MEPLHRLQDVKAAFVWKESCHRAFNGLKKALCEAPVLACADEHGAFVVDTDASDVGVGAVLSQLGADGEKVVSYFSASLTKVERRYCVTRRELLAIVRALKQFRYYLSGVRFKIRTDHAALQWLLSFREPEGQTARWLEFLQEFDFEIVHRAGKKHGNADALSRRPCASDGCAHCERTEGRESPPRQGECRALREVGLADWEREQDADNDLAVVRGWVRGNARPERDVIGGASWSVKYFWGQFDALRIDNGVLQHAWVDPPTGERRWRIVVPKTLRHVVMESAHGTPGSGHFGRAKTLARIRQAFFWGSMIKDVDDFCRVCDRCTAQKGPSGQSKAPLQQRQSGAPMERIAVDVVGPLPRTDKGNRYILTAVDYFTKWPEAYAIADQEAETVCDALLGGMLCRFGVPEELHSDQGRNFESRVFASLCDKLGIHKTRTTTLHPQSDGLVERFHRTMKTQLAIMVSENQKDWDEKLPLVVMSYRSAVQTSTGCTPALLMLGRELRTPALLAMGQPPDVVDVEGGPEYARRLQGRLEVAHSYARGSQGEASGRQRRFYDLSTKGRHFEVGEQVWVYNPKRKKGRCPKLDSHWEGPCVVLERVGPVTYRVQVVNRRKRLVLHRDRLAPYRGKERADLPSAGTDPGDAAIRPAAVGGGGDEAPLGAESDDDRGVCPGLTPPDRGRVRPQRARRPPASLADFDLGRVELVDLRAVCV